MEWRIAENRRDARTLCQGEVRFFLEGRDSACLGDLVDVSNNGFRAKHHEPAIETGMVVEFVHKFFRGQARVAWSRIVNGNRESGFHIIRE